MKKSLRQENGPQSIRSDTDDTEACLERRQTESQRRQHWILLFALVLASLASIAKAETAGRLGVCYRPTLPDAISVVRSDRRAESAPSTEEPVLERGVPENQNPKYLEMTAKLSNFDANAEPDGWAVRLVLKDAQDRPVKTYGLAVFEVMTVAGLSKSPNRSKVPVRSKVPASKRSVRWTRQLHFDADGVADVKLPLRATEQQRLGWRSSQERTENRVAATRATVRGSRTRRYHDTFVTLDAIDAIGMPNHGVLRARITVPSRGVFEAVAPIGVRASVLVDTQWPYR